MIRCNNQNIPHAIFLLLIVILLSGCGIHRSHEFLLVKREPVEAVGGWVVTPSLVRFTPGSSETVDEYSLIINASPTEDKQRYRLGIDSVQFMFVGGALLDPPGLLLVENRATETAEFTRRVNGLHFPADIQELICRVHMTQITLSTNERWNRSADYPIASRWHKKVWFFRRP